MTKLHDLKSTPGARVGRKRKGRGIGSGLGKTAGRGQKGQKSRSGGGTRRGFEGGQMPLSRRLPKRGFTNIFREEIAIVNIKDLDRFADGVVITPELLYEEGLVKKRDIKIKLLGKGDLDRPLTIRVHQASKSAADKVSAAGGKVEVI
ncbi:MAG: 50S ribosomal protein L15 [Syntrophaceticus sp.]|nr:50S ribosomal protein L15 [Syntrophaceticus sp.]HBG23434.1 50S ribosomal protein L15 [Peptococcaceae bacterium]MDD3314113.1 50S ribosomal protein L15 [Syntrophaceticus sp.]MDD4360245.1 50S ribosomal protein L15 [Syntrophaceticus sp.]MDD4782176.1 50S ribosomal protein L15 [Syntrophaceticus sp.]